MGTPASELDAFYLAGLSDDAMPAYTSAARNAPASLRSELRDNLPCPGEDTLRFRSTERPTGVAALNLSVARANDALDQAC